MISAIFIFLGVFLVFTGSIGVLIFPDFYSRVHPAGKIDSLALLLVVTGCIIYNGFDFVAVKLLLIVAFTFIASPTATHSLMKAAYKSGVKYFR